ncbi:hypothetical protein ACFYE2_18020, partial [Kocuria sp. CPCC 205300]|uniref:hypothetical protein n=1 Tax=Kocuria sabuli TaxID=3071448 RepID=UPI0036DA6AD5
DACMEGKVTRIPFNSHFKAATTVLEAVHADIVGPISPATNSGARYFLTLVDQYSGDTHTEILKLKSDAPAAILEFKTFFEKQTGNSITKLITDGGGEFRANRTVIEMTRTFMKQANMAPESFFDLLDAGPGY